MPFQAGEFGFTVDCITQSENMLSIDKGQLDLVTGAMGKLDETALQKVINAIGYVMKSNCTLL